MPKPVSSCQNGILSYYIVQQEGFLLSFDILFMFLGHTNPNLWVSVNAVVLDLCKMQLKVEILHDFKEF